MNRDVYQEIREEILGQKNVFERINKLIHGVTREEGIAHLESIEASFEFFVQRMLFAFKNEVTVISLLEEMILKAEKWVGIERITERNEYDSFLDIYFSEIICAMESLVTKADKIPFNNDVLGLVLIVKNEARYLPEWIEYHKAVGINRFFIYDNESTDDIRTVLQSYIDDGSVSYIWCPGKLRQYPAYADALDRFRYEVKYMGFIDTDEFILPVKGDNVTVLVEELFDKHKEAGGIVVSWRMFGSDGHITDDGKPVIGSFLHRAENSFWQHQHVKSICNPRVTVTPNSPHHFEYLPGYHAFNERDLTVDGPYDLSGEYQECKMLQINHYYVKSKEYYYKVKMKRGFADSLDFTYKDEYFEINDRNEVEDSRMLRYLPVVQQNLRVRGLDKHESCCDMVCDTYGEKNSTDLLAEEIQKNKSFAHKIAELIHRDMKYGRSKRAMEKYPYIKLCRLSNDDDLDLLTELLDINRNETKENSYHFWSFGSDYKEIYEKYDYLRTLLYRVQDDCPIEDYIPALKSGFINQSYTVSAVRSVIDKHVLDRTKVYERLLTEGLPIGRNEIRHEFICPICGNKERILTFENSNKSVRKKFDFPWWAAAFTWESTNEVYCASCGASSYERTAAMLTGNLMDKSNQRVALLAYSPVLGQWVHTQPQISEFISFECYSAGQKEKAELQEFFSIEPESCDVIIVFDTFNRAEDDVVIMHELNRILKRNGFLIVLNSVGIGITETVECGTAYEDEIERGWALFGGGNNRRCYAEHDLINRMFDNGFYVGRIDSDYLTSDIFMKLGLPDRFQVYICTKDPKITIGIPKRRVVIDDRCIVSFIVLTNGDSADLKKTINDIRKQIYPTKEIVVVAERLKNEEREVLYGLKNKALEVFEFPGSSRSEQRNLGIEKTVGNYIVFVESGTLYDPNFVVDAVTLLESDNNTEIAYADAMIKEKFIEAGRICPDNSIDKSRTSGDVFFQIAKSNFPYFSAVIIRRNAIKSHGGFDETLGNKGEKEFLLRIIHGKRAAEIPKVLVTTEVDRENPFEDIEDSINELLKICLEFNLGKSNPEVYICVVQEILSVFEGYCGADQEKLAMKIYERISIDEIFQEPDMCLIRRVLRI